MNWPIIFSSFVLIIESLQKKEFQTGDRLLLSSQLRELMQTIRPGLETAGFTRLISDDQSYIGEDYIPVFQNDIEEIMRLLQQL